MSGKAQNVQALIYVLGCSLRRLRLRSSTQPTKLTYTQGLRP